MESDYSYRQMLAETVQSALGAANCYIAYSVWVGNKDILPSLALRRYVCSVLPGQDVEYTNPGNCYSGREYVVRVFFQFQSDDTWETFGDMAETTARALLGNTGNRNYGIQRISYTWDSDPDIKNSNGYLGMYLFRVTMLSNA